MVLGGRHCVGSQDPLDPEWLELMGKSLPMSEPQGELPRGADRQFSGCFPTGGGGISLQRGPPSSHLMGRGCVALICFAHCVCSWEFTFSRAVLLKASVEVMPVEAFQL